MTATRTDTAPAPRTGTPSGVVLDPDGLLVTRFSTSSSVALPAPGVARVPP